MINTEAVAAGAPHSRRAVTLAAIIGLLVTVLLGAALLGASPAHATTTPPNTPTSTAKHVTNHADDKGKAKPAAATRTSGIPDWDIVVGGLAGIAMLGTAGAVLWYTARSRYLY